VALLNSKVSSTVNAGGFGGAGTTGNVTIPSGGSSGQFYTYTTGGTGLTSPSYTLNTGAGSTWATVGTGYTPSIKVTGDAEFDGKVKINGQDLAEFMDTISKRLAILVPDPAKLEKFEALKKAYNHYKLLEALCHETEDAK
jgi:hypothetical protein